MRSSPEIGTASRFANGATHEKAWKRPSRIGIASACAASVGTKRARRRGGATEHRGERGTERDEPERRGAGELEAEIDRPRGPRDQEHERRERQRLIGSSARRRHCAAERISSAAAARISDGIGPARPT